MKVLVADDETEILDILTKVFESKGHEVIKFSDGKTAQENALQKIPDLIILDVLMPKLSGWEVCRNLKSNAKTKNIPIVILTAKTKNVDELMSAEVGADLYIKKPFNPIEMADQALKLIGGKK